MFLPRGLCQLRGHGFLQPRSKGFQRHGALVCAVLTNGDRTFGDFFLTDNHKDRDPEQRNFANAFAKRLITVVYGSANIGIFQIFTNFFCIISVFFADWQYFHLVRSQP